MIALFYIAFFLLWSSSPQVASFVIDVRKDSVLSASTRSARGNNRLLYAVSNSEKVDEGAVEKRKKSNKAKSNFEYAALAPGSPVRIQVGDVSLARKAWKKRRRSGSPLLVPCSILNVNRRDMLRDNILYLLQNFGRPLSKLEIEQVGFVTNDICLSLKQIRDLYNRYLGSSLPSHASALGYSKARLLIQDLFSPEEQEEYGVRLFVEPPEPSSNSTRIPGMWLMAPLSRIRARRMASRTALVQVRRMDRNATRIANEDQQDGIQEDGSTNDMIYDHLVMQHTGWLRTRNQYPNAQKKYVTVPLSAAIRVSQVESNTIQSGSVHDAVFLSLDLLGDGGSPLMTVSLHRTKSQVINQKRLSRAANRHYGRDRQVRVVTEHKERKVKDGHRDLREIKVGDGPIKAKVLRMSQGSAAAFVDCDVRRSTKDGTTKVLGMLRFDDIVQAALGHDESAMHDDGSAMAFDGEQLKQDDAYDVDATNEDDDFHEEDGDVLVLKGDAAGYSPSDDDEEEEEDIDMSHFVSIDDGLMTFENPETGESVVLSDSSIEDDEVCDEEEEEDDDDLFKNMSPEERLDLISTIMKDRLEETNPDNDLLNGNSLSSTTTISTDPFKPEFVQIGDEVDVYIKSVHKQSGRFMVTLDPSVKGCKAKDLKHKSEVEKRLARLAENMGGSLDRIVQLEGTECDGVVQAISKTGGWLYVRPTSIDDLPVGVATFSPGDGISPLSKGDAVRVRIEGIDESRGQLAMSLI